MHTYAIAAPGSAAERFAEAHAAQRVHGTPVARHELRDAGLGATRSVPAPVIDAALQRGEPLDPATRASNERRLGHDFSRVRVHSDEVADRSVRAIGARAYATGQHIVFARGQYRPHTEDGQQMLAHELAHVAWQAARGPAHAVYAFGLLSPRHYTHVVTAGESLSVVVDDEYGNSAVMPIVGERNGLQPPIWRILAGDELALPPIVRPEHSTHTVTANESLSEIVRDEYGDAELWPEVARRMGLVAPFTVRPSQLLQLPWVAARGANIPSLPPASVRAPQPVQGQAPPQQGIPRVPDAPPRDAGASERPRDAGGSERPRDAGASERPAEVVGGMPPQDAGASDRPGETVPAAPPPVVQPQSQGPTAGRQRFPRSADTTTGRGATPRDQAMDEWTRFSRVQGHFARRFEDYLSRRPDYQRVGIMNPAEYIERNIRTITFFGQRAQGHAAHMQPVLAAAEARLRTLGVTPQFLAQPRGASAFQGFVPRTIRGSQRISNHATGHAIDINPGQNPMIRNPDEPNHTSAFRIIEAATGQRMQGLPRDQGQHTRVAVDEMRVAGERFHDVFGASWLRTQRARLRHLRQLTSPTATEIAERARLEEVDRAATFLETQPRTAWGMDHLRDVARAPGFISLEWELIDSLRRAGFRWGGDYQESVDFMHFELDQWI